MVFTTTFASSIFSPNIEALEQEFGVDEVIATLGVALYLLGFVFSPVVFGPASEVFGRRIPLFIGFFMFAIFQIPVALAPNMTTICVCRFIGGFFACAPLSIVGGNLSDLWDPIPRSYAICAFSIGGFAGPILGPVVGGFITTSKLGWRWTAWITLIMAGLFGGIGFLVIPETSGQRILQLRARRLRRETGNTAYHAKRNLEKRITPKRVVTVFLYRPFKMFFQEPILGLITAYMSFNYGILYLLFEAYPVSYHEDRGWSLSISQLPFLAMLLGVGAGASMIAYSAATNFSRAYKKHGKAIPEERLPPMIVGAIALPIGLFWFAWTSNPHITWVPSVIATAFIGMGLMVPFWQGMTYLIDVYGFYSNSAIAANTFIRSIFGAFFPLFTSAMYHNLGVAWATSLLAFLCVLFAPVPILFYWKGASIRKRSRWVPTTED